MPGDRYAFLPWDGTELHLSQSDMVEEGRSPGTGDYFYLDAGTASVTEAAFLATGVAVASPLSLREWGMNEFVFVDPNANLHRFGEPLPR